MKLQECMQKRVFLILAFYGVKKSIYRVETWRTNPLYKLPVRGIPYFLIKRLIS